MQLPILILIVILIIMVIFITTVVTIILVIVIAITSSFSMLLTSISFYHSITYLCMYQIFLIFQHMMWSNIVQSWQ